MNLTKGQSYPDMGHGHSYIEYYGSDPLLKVSVYTRLGTGFNVTKLYCSLVVSQCWGKPVIMIVMTIHCEKQFSLYYRMKYV